MTVESILTSWGKHGICPFLIQSPVILFNLFWVQAFHALRMATAPDWLYRPGSSPTFIYNPSLSRLPGTRLPWKFHYPSLPSPQHFSILHFFLILQIFIEPYYVQESAFQRGSVIMQRRHCGDTWDTLSNILMVEWWVDQSGGSRMLAF